MKGSSGFSVAMQKHLPEGKASSDVGPNITGSFATDIEAAGTSTGAFYEGGTDPTTGAGNDRYGGVIGFEASRSSPIFGASGTVQPSALQVLACIKF